MHVSGVPYQRPFNTGSHLEIDHVSSEKRRHKDVLPSLHPVGAPLFRPKEVHSTKPRYIYSYEWRQLAGTVTSSISPTPFNEMIALVEANKDLNTFRGVRVVKFKDVDDIRQQLTMAAGRAPTLNPSAEPFIPSQATLRANDAEPSVEATADEANENDAIQVVTEEEDTESPEEDVATIIESIGTSFTNIPEAALAEQHSAAKTLQSYYRRLLTSRANRIDNPGLGLTKIRNNQFEAFARAADTIEWPQGQRSLYRPIFLGALPHLLACLDYTWTITMEEKAKVKRQESQNTGHQDIEKLMDRRTFLWYVNKRLE